MYIGVSPSKDKRLEIVFHVANYNYPTGGIVNSIDFGTNDAVIHLRDINRARDALLISGYTMICLYEELELTESFIKIEKIRYGDRLDIQFDIASNVYAEIPPLTLQPLVENAIQHGLLRKKGCGSLYIGVESVNEGIKIIIRDNGIGMTEEKREEILQGDSKGIGVANSMK